MKCLIKTFFLILIAFGKMFTEFIEITLLIYLRINCYSHYSCVTLRCVNYQKVQSDDIFRNDNVIIVYINDHLTCIGSSIQNGAKFIKKLTFLPLETLMEEIRNVFFFGKFCLLAKWMVLIKKNIYNTIEDENLL